MKRKRDAGKEMEEEKREKEGKWRETEIEQTNGLRCQKVIIKRKKIYFNNQSFSEDCRE